MTVDMGISGDIVGGTTVAAMGRTSLNGPVRRPPSADS
jgi:hypothetical protein